MGRTLRGERSEASEGEGVVVLVGGLDSVGARVWGGCSSYSSLRAFINSWPGKPSNSRTQIGTFFVVPDIMPPKKKARQTPSTIFFNICFEWAEEAGRGGDGDGKDALRKRISAIALPWVSKDNGWWSSIPSYESVYEAALGGATVVTASVKSPAGSKQRGRSTAAKSGCVAFRNLGWGE